MLAQTSHPRECSWPLVNSIRLLHLPPHISLAPPTGMAVIGPDGNVRWVPRRSLSGNPSASNGGTGALQLSSSVNSSAPSSPGWAHDQALYLPKSFAHGKKQVSPPPSLPFLPPPPPSSASLSLPVARMYARIPSERETVCTHPLACSQKQVCEPPRIAAVWHWRDGLPCCSCAMCEALSQQ